MITRDQLYIADEIFITGTAAEIVGVRMVDSRRIGDGGVGPITRSFSKAFTDTVHGVGKFADAWLDYLD